MAIDTALKRKAVAGITAPFMVGVTTDGTPGQEWRQTVGWGYPGILADEPSEETEWPGRFRSNTLNRRRYGGLW